MSSQELLKDTSIPLNTAEDATILFFMQLVGACLTLGFSLYEDKLVIKTSPYLPSWIMRNDGLKIAMTNLAPVMIYLGWVLCSVTGMMLVMLPLPHDITDMGIEAQTCTGITFLICGYAGFDIINHYQVTTRATNDASSE